MKISLTIADLCILNSYVFTQDKSLNKSLKTVIPENSVVEIKNDQYDPTFIQKKGDRQEKNQHISNFSHLNHQNNFQKDLFGLDLIQTTIASEDYYIKSHYVVTEQTGNTAGTIWVVAGIESNPSGNDKIGIYKYEQTGWAAGTNGTILHTTNGGVTFIEAHNDMLIQPNELLFEQNYPNPFNPSTLIRWQSPVGSHQTLKVYDVLGSEVATLVNEERRAGNYEVEFNASQLSSGIYFYRLQAGNFIETKKMVLIR